MVDRSVYLQYNEWNDKNVPQWETLYKVVSEMKY